MALTVGFPCAGFGAGAAVTAPDGRPVDWSDWVSENAPVAVLLWASWVPDADGTLADLGRIDAAVRKRDLELVVVAVQEPLQDASESLGSIDVPWFHDRFGSLLKDYRVVSIPRLLILAEDGRVVERLDARPESVRFRGDG
jgi:thiol-disulfide isomerase/thioredoxin